MLPWIILALVWAFAVVAVPLLVAWTRRGDTYICRRCAHEFGISFPVALLNPQWPTGGGLKYLRCPSCGKRSWAAVNHTGLDLGLVLFWAATILVLLGVIVLLLAVTLR
jgi:DNA-directed RNA polymerase subunit RPC12/RpoP